MTTARTVGRSWLRRSFEVVTPKAVFVVDYHGRGVGWEGVAVDGRFVSGGRSVPWFIPRFEFALGESSGRIEVRVWPWLALRSFALFVDGELLYQE